MTTKSRINKEQYRLLVKKARQLHYEEHVPVKYIAKRFGVSKSTASKVVNGHYCEWYKAELAQKEK